MKAVCYRCKTWENANNPGDVGDCPDCGTPMSIWFTTSTRCREPQTLLNELRERLVDDITNRDEYVEMEIELEKLLKERWRETETRLRARVKES